MTIKRQMGKAGLAVASLFLMEYSEFVYSVVPVPGPGSLSIK